MAKIGIDPPSPLPDGYDDMPSTLSKFGIQATNEVTLIISRERFEDFIGAFLTALPDDEIIVETRPREGDLVYFP